MRWPPIFPEIVPVNLSQPLFIESPGSLLSKNGPKSDFSDFFFFTTLFGSRIIGMTEKRSNISLLFCFFKRLGLDRAKWVTVLLNH